VAAEDIEQVRRQLEERFGLALPTLSAADLASAVAASGPPEQPGFFERVLDALPIDESSLFRHPELWRWLEREVLTGWVDRAMGGGPPVRILSLGCACGQELFSALILCDRLLRARGAVRGFEGRLLRGKGVDASPARIARARSGRLNAWSVQRAPPEWLAGAVAAAQEVGQYDLDPTLLAMAEFEQGNVLDVVRGGQGLDAFDLVLCQNLFIYFRGETARDVLAALVAGLAPRAVLALAPVEAHLAGMVPGCEPTSFVGVVRRAGRAPPPPAPPPVKVARATLPKTSVLPDASLKRLLDQALGASARGQVAEALGLAKSACAADPSSLLAQLVLGRILLTVDRVGGRRVLEALHRRAATLRPDAPVPLADLSVEQLSRAASLLLRSSD
jgi:chemotaxis methyl-accepting protein methylase